MIICCRFVECSITVTALQEGQEQMDAIRAVNLFLRYALNITSLYFLCCTLKN